MQEGSNTHEHKSKITIRGWYGNVDARRYRSLARGLIYLPHIRPYISFLVGVVSRFRSNPSRHHFGVAKRILCYIAGTLDFSTSYNHGSGFKLYGFTDSDWARSMNDRRSISSIVTLGSSAVPWLSKK